MTDLTYGDLMTMLVLDKQKKIKVVMARKPNVDSLKSAWRKWAKKNTAFGLDIFGITGLTLEVEHHRLGTTYEVILALVPKKCGPKFEVIPNDI